MADQYEENLLRDEPPPTTPNERGQVPSKEVNNDLHDTFQLFKFYMEGKMGELESKLVREQDAMSKKLKDDVSIKFKHEGNKIQFNFNEEVMSVLKKSFTNRFHNPKHSVCVLYLIFLIKSKPVAS